MAGRPKSPFSQRRNGVNLVELSFDDVPACQFGHATATWSRRPQYGSMSDLGLCAARLSVAEGRSNGHSAGK